jgi:hypothetical protein
MQVLSLINDVNDQSFLQRLTVCQYKIGIEVALTILHIDSLLLVAAEP